MLRSLRATPNVLPLLLIVAGAAIALTALVGGLATAGNSSATTVTYCNVTATATVAKCPPEPHTRVIGTYQSGIVMTLTWSGREWLAHHPGGRMVPVAAPHDWWQPE